MQLCPPLALFSHQQGAFGLVNADLRELFHKTSEKHFLMAQCSQ